MHQVEVGAHMLQVLISEEWKVRLGVCPQMSRLQHGDIWWFGESTVWGDILAVLRMETVPWPGCCSMSESLAFCPLPGLNWGQGRSKQPRMEVSSSFLNIFLIFPQ